MIAALTPGASQTLVCGVVLASLPLAAVALRALDAMRAALRRVLKGRGESGPAICPACDEPRGERHDMACGFFQRSEGAREK